ncbi:MAG TPA: MBOAT family O-acyltransferase [Chloroflexota bacterium]|nr:MBOAT family O-acyltransferase [Chloroflexota bacterium]
MIFPTIVFAGFFALVLPASWLLMPYRTAWKLFMIAASYYFYAAGVDWHFTLLLAGCTFWNQAFAKLLGVAAMRRYSSWLVAIAVAGDLSMLGIFKYYGFFVTNVVAFTGRFGLPMPLPLAQLLLPTAISFFTFQAISYVVDVKRNKSASISTLDFAVYLAFFPHLLAGPIVRVSELVPQFLSARDPRKLEFSRAMGLICGGLIKKVLIADFLSTQYVNNIFSSPQFHSRLDIVLGVYAYAVQIYCDFSGYTDIAIGIALLLGFQFPQNFNKPYAALSITEFWHRWHMTLSRWLRDYLYVPLGGNRHGRLQTYRNLLLTMLLGGLWHGAAWTFVIWGGLHGAGLAAERWWDESKRKLSFNLPTAVRWFLIFNFICVAWVFFRADSLGNVGSMIGQLLGGTGATTVTPTILLAMFAGMAVHFMPPQPGLALRRVYSRLSPVAQGLAFAAIVLFCGAVITGQGVAPFIYYRF